MADNLVTTAGTLATNEIGGVHYTRSKMGFGVAGVYKEVSSLDPMPAGISDGSDVATGAKADAAWNGVAAAASVIAVLKAIYGALAAVLGVSPKTSVFWNETSTVLAANGVFLGTDRDIGVAAGNLMASSYFNAFVASDQIGTIVIEAKDGSNNYYTVATAPIAANTPLLLSVPVLNRVHRVRVTNGATAQTSLRVNTSYTGA